MTQEIDVEKIMSYSGGDRIVHFTEYLRLKADSLSKIKAFPCSFPWFNLKMGGLETGEVIVITGHRKEGKTTFAESWLRSMCELDKKATAVILSYEMPPEQLLQKYKRDQSMPIFVPMSLQASNFDWLEKRCVEAKYKYNAKIVMIDHLDHMIDMSIMQNSALNIGGFMRRLKVDIAIKHNLAIILVAHQGQPKDGREPSVDSLRGSSSIGQESDATVVVMRRQNMEPVEIRDYVLKKMSSPLNIESEADIESSVLPPDGADPDDKSSAGLAVVKIDCHRRTGTYKSKKLFKKCGDWLIEL